VTRKSPWQFTSDPDSSMNRQMNHPLHRALVAFSLIWIILSACPAPDGKVVTIFLAGDSTVADYSTDDNYMEERYPVTGWGQVFQPFFISDSLKSLRNLISTDSVLVDNRAKGGRSTRTFFQEGRWRSICESLQSGDLVLIQFGHNDAAVNKPERYVDVEGYKEFLRLFIQQVRERDGIPILMTPVNRNYPWEAGELQNVHGAYADAVRDIAVETGTRFIDLTRLSCAHFTLKERDYVTSHYFMNLPPGKYTAYPEGQNDNTHFQPEGAKAVASLVFQAMKEL